MHRFFFISIALPSLLFSHPVFHQQIHGTASLQETGDTLTITASDATILHWKDFSIKEGELTRFLLPSAQSSILNRVVEANPSCLFGQLESNGKVFLINPNGIVIGKNGIINTSAFFASTLDVLDQSFIDKSELVFFGNSQASVVNLGTITATDGEVFLIGRQVENSGTIDAQEEVGVLSSHKIILKPKNANRLFIRSNKDQLEKNCLDNFYVYAFHQNSAPDALHPVKYDDGVYLLSGKITTHTPSGGNVSILGDHIEILDHASIDVSGEFGGGAMLIGGDFQGSNPLIASASTVFIEKEASLFADALVKGDGGKVIVWAEESTGFFGNISAQGGPKGGNGGIIEVSGQHLAFEGTAMTLAPMGERGTLYLDPIDLSITAANLNVTAASPFMPILPGPPSTLRSLTLQGALVGNNVVVTTVGTPTAGNGDITFSTALTILAGSGNLTVNAARDININSAITNNSTATSIAMTAGLTTPGAITNSVAGIISYPMAGSTGTLTLNANNGINLSGVIGPGTGLNTSGVTTIQDNSAVGITITANVQNGAPGTGGNVVLVENGTGPVNIGQALVNRDASVGSANGTSQITAMNSIVNIQAREGGGLRVSQLGYLTPDGGTASGPIIVDCNSLSVRGGGANSGAQIGHGNAHGNIVTNCSTILNAITMLPPNITVNVTNSIEINATNVFSSDAQAFIGHGSGRFDSANVNSCNQIGDITVVSLQGNIDIGHTALNTARSYSKIGHGSLIFVAGGGNFPTITGNITVQAPRVDPLFIFGNITLDSSAAVNGNFVHIGHGGARVFGAAAITEGINISCGSNLTLAGFPPAGASQRVQIGYMYETVTPTIIENIRVSAGNDISLSAIQRTCIGAVIQGGAGAISYTGEIAVAAGNDVILNTIDDAVFIGVDLQGAPAPILNNNVYVAAGRDVRLDLSTVPLASLVAKISAGGDVAVAAGRDIIVASNLVGSFSLIGTTHRNGANASTTLRAARDILAQNISTGNPILGYDSLDFNAAPYSVEIRAGGDIQMARSLLNTDSGTIFVEADTCLLEGDLWGYTGTDLTSICGFPLAFAITETNQLPDPIDTTSAELLADGFGGFRIVTVEPPTIGTNHISFPSTTGNITVHSAPLRRDEVTLENLVVDTAAANSLDISTTDGAIDIGGSLCLCSDAFNNVDIDLIVIPWTTNSIYGRAANDFSVNITIQTIGLISPITLIADCDNSNGGILALNASINTNEGSISLSSGIIEAGCIPGFPCTSSIDASNARIDQNAGTILCGGTGTCTLVSAGTINVNSVSAESGFIHMLAGDSINVTGTIQNTDAAGDVLLVANNNITMTAGSILSPNPVTLVVDNINPSAPDIGLTQTFNMDASSVINGSRINIYTASQYLNSILGLLNGVLFPDPPGTLFQNYALEHWCTYFDCNDVNQFASLGTPFTIFYKNCLQTISEAANIVVSELLFDLQPIYIEWPEEFFDLWRYRLLYDRLSKNSSLSSLTTLEDEYYWITRKKYHFLHNPYVNRGL